MKEIKLEDLKIKVSEDKKKVEKEIKIDEDMICLQCWPDA